MQAAAKASEAARKAAENEIAAALRQAAQVLLRFQHDKAVMSECVSDGEHACPHLHICYPARSGFAKLPFHSAFSIYTIRFPLCQGVTPGWALIQAKQELAVAHAAEKAALDAAVVAEGDWIRSSIRCSFQEVHRNLMSTPYKEWNRHLRVAQNPFRSLAVLKHLQLPVVHPPGRRVFSKVCRSHTSIGHLANIWQAPAYTEYVELQYWY